MNIAFLYLILLLFFCACSLFITLAIYFIPVVVAYIRRHKNLLAITIMTIFVGWTFFGWLASLLWALNSDIDKDDEED